MTRPVFAVVGHPNKGKSSIVATLAGDESVAISALPGTTAAAREYPMVVDGETLYVLIDTPGFQRAREALEWMQAQSGSSVDRPDIVRRFVEQHRQDERFAAECRLLAPLLEGAGILYVVDGSRPFGDEYEAEMEILRWTGQPSLALINMIGSGDYRGEWQKALGQFFRIVRVFNAMNADFDKRVQLLLAFGQLREDWRPALERAVQALQAEQALRRSLAARLIAECLAAMIVHRRRQAVPDTAPGEPLREQLRAAYRRDLVSMENDCRRQVEQVYHYRHLQRQEALVEVLDADLFAAQTWRLFGLTRQQLVATGGLGGAAAGGVVDVAVGGHSLLLGTGIGALIGGISAWATADRVADIKLLGRPLGGQELSVGPMRNINFPYVVLGRALWHQRMVEDRTHASRAPLEIAAVPGALQVAGLQQRKSLEKIFAALRKQAALEPALLDRLSASIEGLMQAGDTAPP